MLLNHQDLASFASQGDRGGQPVWARTDDHDFTNVGQRTLEGVVSGLPLGDTTVEVSKRFFLWEIPQTSIVLTGALVALRGPKSSATDSEAS